MLFQSCAVLLAIAHRQDPDDPYTVWELLYLDAVINLEDWQGKFTRVGVFLVAEENQAYRILKQAQKPALTTGVKASRFIVIGCFVSSRNIFPVMGNG
jgi:UTP-glucose-1-phosphate uridylyltransferase